MCLYGYDEMLRQNSSDAKKELDDFFGMSTILFSNFSFFCYCGFQKIRKHGVIIFFFIISSFPFGIAAARSYIKVLMGKTFCYM